MNQRPATSAEVARAANVSRATVSYVMNPLSRYVVADATRERVLRAAAALGYTPSMSARSLRGKKELVLAIVPDWTIADSTSRFLSALTAEVQSRGLTFLIRYSNDGIDSLEQLWRSLGPAAVLSFTEIAPERIARAAEEGVSVTLAFFDSSHDAPHDIELPEEATGRVQVDHLVDFGRRRLAIVLPTDERLATFFAPRARGVRERCAARGLDAPVELAMAPDPDSGASAVERMLTAGVDGVCCYNDVLALAILAGARVAGVAVPERIAVIGVDDEPFAAMSVPSLTTVRLDVEQKAANVADAIVAGIAGEPLPSGVDRSEIVVVRRESS